MGVDAFSLRLGCQPFDMFKIKASSDSELWAFAVIVSESDSGSESEDALYSRDSSLEN